MKRKQLHQSNHPFNPQPFEAFWSGSWQPVEQLSICDGAMITHVVDDGEVIEDQIPLQNLRVRSREATWSDCMSFLRPGIDVCVLSNTHTWENELDQENNQFVWLDARIRSIERKTHGNACTCRFHVSFYITQGPDLFLENKRLSKRTSMVSIHQIAIIQNLEQKPSDTEYYRWRSTEDCLLLNQPRFLQWKFSADLTWLLIASVLKKIAFDVKSIQNHIVYEISDRNPSSRNQSYAVGFKLDSITPVVVQFSPDNLSEGFDDQDYVSPSYDLLGLRRSKRRHVQPERYLACDNLPDYEIEVTQLGGNKIYKANGEIKVDYDEDEYEKMSSPLSVEADEYDENSVGENRSSFNDRKMSKKPQQQKTRVRSDFKIQKDEPEEDIDEIFSQYMKNGPSSLNKKTHFNSTFMDSDSGGGTEKKGPSKKYAKKSGCSMTSRKSECFYVRDGTYDVKSFSKGSTSAGVSRELIRQYMINIDDTLRNKPKQPPLVERWKEFQMAAKKTEEGGDKDGEKPAAESAEEVSEVDMLWREMQLAIASWYLLDDNEDHIQPRDHAENSSRNVCKHDYTLDEQIGTVCQLCGFVETEIRDILPPFVSSSQWTSNKDKMTGEVLEPKTDEDASMNQYSIPTPSSTPSVDVRKHANVWDLIPDLGGKLRPHQRKAFKFLWKNIAGSMVPSRMEKKKKRRGGCVISHTPGAGKTLLIIAFLGSYLKLFPRSRPLILAPKTTLYTWHKELIKWKISVPVYTIHGVQTYKSEVLQQQGESAQGLPKNPNVLHVLDSLEKMQNWLSHPSILLMGYPSFLTLTREDSEYAHRKYMAQLLKHCPGILILDEGHNPRSTKSRLRKGLMKVDTRLRILLSGTLFQNNFGEYFNTLCLARPRFVDNVLKELDPKYKRRSKKSRRSLENRARKFMIDKISKKIESNVAEERAQAVMTLKKLTSKFIDVYEGGDWDNLPGLQCYTLMMKLTSLQQEVLAKLQDRGPANRGFPLELEFLVTLAAIHPCLMKSTECSGHYLTPDELEDLETSKFDVKSGSKVRFVMRLVPRCILQNEKVLIFCHNIAPINLFVQMFERVYGWRKGREVLVLHGKMELFERGREIDKFEEPGGPSKVMLASIKACAEGISLTAGSRVILIDSEWNPSKSKQAIARAFRPGQNRVVYVYQLLAAGTLEEEKHGRTTWKEWVSDMIFSEEHVVDDRLKWEAPRIEDEMLREIVEEDRAVMFHQIMKNEKAYNVIRGKGVMKNVSN